MLVVRGALVLGIVGTALGTGAALMATRLLESELDGVQRTDPSTFVAAAVVVTAVLGAAALVHARRVARLDPVQAVRHLNSPPGPAAEARFPGNNRDLDTARQTAGVAASCESRQIEVTPPLEITNPARNEARRHVRSSRREACRKNQ